MLAERIDLSETDILTPQVAGVFYPGDRATLEAHLKRCILSAQPTSIRQAKVLVSPHAGFAFSGNVAASAYNGLASRAAMINRVVIVGPAHKFSFRGIALHPAKAWRTPLGDVPVDTLSMKRLDILPEVTFDERPFLNEHSIETQLPFLQVSLDRFQIIPMLIGDATPAAVARALEMVWGGPETLIVISSDLSHFLQDEQAKKLDGETRRLIEVGAAGRLDSQRACGHRAISGALLASEKFDMRVTCIDLKTSGDVTDERERVVGYGAFAMEYSTVAQLAGSERGLLLATAARVLAYACTNSGKTPDVSVNGDLPMTLSAMRATFVTLEKQKRLRGCIGSLRPVRPLLLDVIANTVKAGFADPRFPALTMQEMLDLDLSIAILSNQRPIEFRNERELIDELSPDRDGLIIEDQGKSALFLPHVWSSIPDPKIFVAALKQKAGLAGDHWSPTFRARRFTTEKFGKPIAELLK